MSNDAGILNNTGMSNNTEMASKNEIPVYSEIKKCSFHELFLDICSTLLGAVMIVRNR